MGVFREWLEKQELHEGAGRPANKSGLYPLGYGGLGLYPLQVFIAGSADAITYLSMDDRMYLGIEGKPFSIKHIKPGPTFTYPLSPLPEPKTPKSFRKPNAILSPKDETSPR